MQMPRDRSASLAFSGCPQLVRVTLIAAQEANGWGGRIAEVRT
jgi:hypothetical protein